MWTAAFPEPLTFSLRALRALRQRAAATSTSCTTTRCSAYGMLGIGRLGLPAGDEHPPPDQRGPADRAGGRAGPVPAVQAALVRVRPDAGPGRPPGRPDPDRVGVLEADDICRDFRVRRGQRAGHPAGRGHAAVPPPASAPGAGPDPGRGQRRLAGQGRRHAAARGRQAGTERDVAADRGRPARRRAARPSGWSPSWRSATRCGSSPASATPELAELAASAEIAVVPSLYEGFSLPAVEHMASGTPLVASRTGALPEVTGDAALLVTPGDAAGTGRGAAPAARLARPSATGSCAAAWTGCSSGSPGRPWPARPSRSTGRRSRHRSGQAARAGDAKEPRPADR